MREMTFAVQKVMDIAVWLNMDEEQRELYKLVEELMDEKQSNDENTNFLKVSAVQGWLNDPRLYTSRLESSEMSNASERIDKYNKLLATKTNVSTY